MAGDVDFYLSADCFPIDFLQDFRLNSSRKRRSCFSPYSSLSAFLKLSVGSLLISVFSPMEMCRVRDILVPGLLSQLNRFPERPSATEAALRAGVGGAGTKVNRRGFVKTPSTSAH